MHSKDASAYPSAFSTYFWRIDAIYDKPDIRRRLSWASHSEKHARVRPTSTYLCGTFRNRGWNLVLAFLSSDLCFSLHFESSVIWKDETGKKDRMRTSSFNVRYWTMPMYAIAVRKAITKEGMDQIHSDKKPKVRCEGEVQAISSIYPHYHHQHLNMRVDNLTLSAFVC